MQSVTTPRERSSESPARQPQQRKGARRERQECCVRVVARFRPPVTEEEKDRPSLFRVCPTGRAVESTDGNYHFDLDCAFSEDSTQEDVYAYVGKPIVEDVLSGYNGTAFAYGQTGSGKTHAMFGPGFGSGRAELHGIVPRAAWEIFDRIAAARVDSVREAPEFTLHCSFLEVYREQMRDLLNLSNQALRVKELPQRGLFVDGLSQERVRSAEEVLGLVGAGCRLRAVAATRQNQHSSRSHAILVLTVEQQLKEGAERLGKLTLVDLAGSEKVSKSECVGETLEEAKKINWSLTALGKVIDALAEQRPHVPYRDSRLTRVLEEALGGNCRTTLLVAASASPQHHDETLSSLRFATRAKKVRCHAKVNYVYSSDQLLQLVSQLQCELARAKREAASYGLCAEVPRGVRRAPLGGGLGLDLGSLRLAYSGSCPSVGQGKVLLDIGETSCLDEAPLSRRPSVQHTPSRQTSPSRQPSPSRQTSPVRWRRSEEEDVEVYAPEDMVSADDMRDEAWRPLALAARDAVLAMEEALVAQERTMQEAAQLREDQGWQPAALPGRSRSAATGLDAQGGLPCMEALAERFRGLRHALDARGLQWRLQAERRKREALELELEMQTRYSEELEKTLERQASTRPAELLRSPAVIQPSRAEHSHPPQRPEAGSLGENNRKAPLIQRGHASQAAAAGSATAARSTRQGTAASGASSSTGPKQRNNNRTLQRQGRNPSGPVAESAQHSVPSIPRPASQQQDNGAPASSRTLTPATVTAQDSALISACSSKTATPAATTVLSTQAHTPNASPCQWPRSFSACATEGEAFSFEIPPACGGTEGNPQLKVLPQLSPAEIQRHLTATEQLHAALTARVEQLQEEVKLKGQQLSDMAAEVSCQGVSTSTLRHAVRIKGTLLAKLEADQLRREEESAEEVERLMAKAMSSLATILPTSQLAVAAAEGERANLPET